MRVCPYCGERDEELLENNQNLSKQVIFLNQKVILLQETLDDHVRAISEYVKSKKNKQ